MSAPNDGGPAFPTTESHESPNFPGHRDVYASSGMTLRDWFAGQALAGWLASFADDASHPCERGYGTTVAADAYKLADAMLTEREKEKQP